MQKSPGSRALWRSGLFSLCAGALISLVLLRFLSQLDQPGLTPEDLRRSGAALALQILSISAAAIGFVTYTSLRTRSSLEQALTARPGVAAQVDLQAKTATVTGTADDAALKKAVEDAGYQVVSIS